MLRSRCEQQYQCFSTTVEVEGDVFIQARAVTGHLYGAEQSRNGMGVSVGEAGAGQIVDLGY